MSPDQLWHATLGELELELSKANFTTWFDETFILRADGDSVVVGVPNAFTKRWLEDKYHQSILKALRRICDNDVRTIAYQVISKDQADTQAPSESVTSATEVASISSVPNVTPPKAKTAQKANKNNQNTVSIQVKAPAVSAVDSNEIGLNPHYTFQSFIVGKKNELAHAACLAVAERPGFAYNPLFIYGGVGLGKTHLMQAVGNAVLEKTPDKKILYVTCETFTNEYIRLVQAGRADQFQDKYRSVDLLLVDDIQFLAGKEGTQEAFFHAFNHLQQRNKQIIMTSDRPPRAIPALEGRLVSRFEGGMVADVNIPDLETRIAILRRKSEDKQFPLSQEVAQYIASNVQNNVRELEGALNRIIGYHQLNKQEPTLDSVKSLLASYSHTPKRGAVTTKKILATVSQFFDVELKDLIGNSRKKELVVPRQIAMFLMREEIHASYPNIGHELGGRDHTTAMHACQKITRLFEDDEKTQSDIGNIKQRLYN